MKRELKVIVLIILISQLSVSCFSACAFSEESCTNIVNDETKNGTEEILNKDDIVTAFINAMNKMTWEYIDNDNNTYDKIIKQESLQEPTNYKIYFSKENVLKKDKYYIDFIYQIKNNYLSLRISYSP